MLLMTRWKDSFPPTTVANKLRRTRVAQCTCAHSCEFSSPFAFEFAYDDEHTETCPIWRILFFFDCSRDPMELMEQQLVRCGVAPVRLYEHLAMSSPVAVAAAAAAALGVQQQQQPSAQQQQQQQHENSGGGHALSPWLSPSAALLYGARGAAGSPSPYPAVAAAATPGFPYSALPWPWQPPPPVAMISRRSSPPTAASLRYAPYPPRASTPPPLRPRPPSPN